ncbi:MAG: hypothetical protein PVG41_19665, partial [Desulfobacteraceae bacterium]
MDHADAVDESDPIFRFVEKVKRAAAADSGISYKGGGMSDIYMALAKHLNNLPGGFPATESGIELRILKRLFSPQE